MSIYSKRLWGIPVLILRSISLRTAPNAYDLAPPVIVPLTVFEQFSHMERAIIINRVASQAHRKTERSWLC